MSQNESTPRKTFSSFIRILINVLPALILGLVLFYVVMRPPMNEFAFMLRLMSITAVFSVILTFFAYRLGWIFQIPSMRITIVLGSIISALVVFINIWIIARLMFASPHDLQLATILLIFAVGISVPVGLYLSESLINRIQVLNNAALSIADGDLKMRVPVNGKDELAQLSRSFNKMAAELESSKLEQAKIEALRKNLIAWVSHDLRTPLTSIRAMLEALSDGLIEDDQTKNRYINTSRHQIEELSKLINDLFLFSQIDAGGMKLNIQANNLSDLISDNIESFHLTANAQDIILEGCMMDDIDPVWMDIHQINRVVNNLISNAIRFTPHGGRVDVCAKRKDNAVIISVSDTGEGIAPEDLPHVFEQFYRVEQSRNRGTGGAGLGLTIVKSIVEAHGGTITVTSQVGKGTLIEVSLPQKLKTILEVFPS
jgi:signal transduction histidine kinase